MNAQTTQAQTEYPNRYYAKYDPRAAQPAPVIGWCDMWSYSILDGTPPLSELLPLTKEFWQQHIAQPQALWAVQDGRLVPYTPPPPPLKDMAKSALSVVMSQAAYVIARQKTFGPNTLACIQKLEAIIDGTDTTSTELPTVPSDLTT